jgi:hypothetical protein
LIVEPSDLVVRVNVLRNADHADARGTRGKRASRASTVTEVTVVPVIGTATRRLIFVRHRVLVWARAFKRNVDRGVALRADRWWFVLR